MNKVFIAGRLAQETETSQGSNDKAFLVNALAIKNYNGDAEFFNFIAFDKTAELIDKYLKKGETCILECHMTINEYEGQKNIRLVADRVEFTGGATKTDDDEAPKKSKKKSKKVEEEEVEEEEDDDW